MKSLVTSTASIVTAVILTFGSYQVNASTMPEIIAPPVEATNSGEHNDRQHCQLLKRRGKAQPYYCSIYM